MATFARRPAATTAPAERLLLLLEEECLMVDLNLKRC